MATAIFYASNTGTTQDVAKRISQQLGDIDCFDISDSGIERILEFDKIILGTPTWGEGELADDWLDIWDDFSDLDLSGKTVALFGVGDQDGYGEFYCDAMGIIYEKVIAQGGNVIGKWDIDTEYYHEASLAIKDESFVGLALDEDNQDDLTDERIEKWCEQIENNIL